MVRFALLTWLAVGASALPDSGPRLFGRAACNHNNCYRQVAASAFAGGPARGSADCSSVLATTVTPCPVTSTATDTVTSTITTVAGSPIVAKRALEARITPPCSASSSSSSAIPTYASSCHNLAQYSSACSCNGVTGSVMTLPPVTSTVTSTTTTTTYVAAPSCAAGASNVCCALYFEGLCAGASSASQDSNGVYSCGSGTYACCYDCTPSFPGACGSCNSPS